MTLLLRMLSLEIEGIRGVNPFPVVSALPCINPFANKLC